MYYQLSNNCSIDSIETEFKTRFQFSHLYREKPIIDGHSEQIIPIIISEKKHHISFGIWGMLPANYKGDWTEFHQLNNTLNTSLQSSFDSQHSIFEQKKCVIIVSGFFTHFIKYGEIYTYYVHHVNHKPFLLGGIYNQLEDGFMTCSLLLTEASPFIKKINNLNDQMPIVIKKERMEEWFEETYIPENTSTNFIADESLQAHTISKHIKRKGLLKELNLEPKKYRTIPTYYSSDTSKNSNIIKES